LQAFKDSRKFVELGGSMQCDYRFCRKVIERFPTRDGRIVSDLIIHRLTAIHIFKLLETAAKNTPSKANHMLCYLGIFNMRLITYCINSFYFLFKK